MSSKPLVVEYPNLRPTLWAQNGHVQTLASLFLKTQKSTRIALKRVVNLNDGDRIVIHDDTSKSWITGDRIAVLVHGLCGCHNSPHIRRIAIRLRRHGIRTIRVDMRGFGDSTLISRGHLHAGRSNDLNDVVKFVDHISPLSKISLIGFSLGANVMLKLLADWSEVHPIQVDSAIAVSPPIDLGFCSANLRSFGNRMYDYFFVHQLSKALKYRRRHVKGLLDNGMNPIPNRLVHFDDRFTAPLSGFAGARDYYEKCSTIGRLKQIRVPTIIVAAKDDPIVPFEMFDDALFSSDIELVHTKNGGHLGFLGNQPMDPDQHWLDWRICRWLSSLDS